MEIAQLGRGRQDWRSQKPTGGPLLTNQRVGRQRILRVVKERSYRCLKLPDLEVTGAGGLWSVGAESAGFQAVETENVAGD
jgi:hypothetical protein